MSLESRRIGLITRETGSFELFKLECCCILLSHIGTIVETKHILSQIDKLLIIWVVEIWNDGHPVVQLEAKREHRIINQDQVFQVAIFDDSEIFNEDTLVCLKAVLTIQPEVDERSIWIDQIYDSISILLMTRCEDTDLVFCTAL